MHGEQNWSHHHPNPAGKENFNRQELLPVQFLPCILQAGIAELNNEQGNQGLSELGQILNPK